MNRKQRRAWLTKQAKKLFRGRDAQILDKLATKKVKEHG